MEQSIPDVFRLTYRELTESEKNLKRGGRSSMVMREIDYNYEYPIKAIRYKDWEINVRKMRKDEMPDNGVTYYVEQNGAIYQEGEKDFELIN